MEQKTLSPECQQKIRDISQTYRSYEDFNQRINPDTDILFATNERKAIMEDYSTLAMLDAALGPNTSSRWLVTLLANLNKFSGSKNMDDGQTENLARLIAQEYSDMKYSVMMLFFYRFKCGYFGRFYGKVDPMVITCALKDFAEECERKKQEYLHEEYLKKQNDERLFFESAKNCWYDLIHDLMKYVTDEDKTILSDIFVTSTSFENKCLQLAVTKQQYKLLKNKYQAYYRDAFKKHFSELKIQKIQYINKNSE